MLLCSELTSRSRWAGPGGAALESLHLCASLGLRCGPPRGRTGCGHPGCCRSLRGEVGRDEARSGRSYHLRGSENFRSLPWTIQHIMVDHGRGQGEDDPSGPHHSPTMMTVISSSRPFFFIAECTDMFAAWPAGILRI